MVIKEDKSVNRSRAIGVEWTLVCPAPFLVGTLSESFTTTRVLNVSPSMPARRHFIQSVEHQVAIATYVACHGSIQGFKDSVHWSTAVELWDETLKETKPDLYSALDKLEDKEFQALADEMSNIDTLVF